ncbi:unnamed protein product [Prorocentrum cordatum]|uniref:EXS domain-containing protein n=1 Tax=Prorocentrum cordatum TaxID=2364126 RepID=A0ABN9QKA2_9DINO|nr:unnamed protein product [Polarella glacialis]
MEFRLTLSHAQTDGIAFMEGKRVYASSGPAGGGRGRFLRAHRLPRDLVAVPAVAGDGGPSEELVRPTTLLFSALGGSLLLSSLASVAISIAQSTTSGLGLWSILSAYFLCLSGLFCWLPEAFASKVRWREPLARTLWRCVWPIRSAPTPFVEVLVADGLTSTAKVFFDLAMVSCAAFNSMDLWRPTALAISMSEDAALQGQRRTLLGEATDQCSRSSVPFFFWAAPFLIRGYQCILTIRNTKDGHTSQMQMINLAKYVSSLPIVLFAFGYAQNQPEFSMDPEDFEVLWALAAIVNSVFSLMWDLVMDWGILQATGPPCTSRHFGLRPNLLFRSMWGFYHFAILLNLGGPPGGRCGRCAGRRPPRSSWAVSSCPPSSRPLR